MKKILLVGESWTSQSTHYKGFDTFQSTYYELGANAFVDSLKENYDVNYMPSHIAQTEFPSKLSNLKEYDSVIISDCGANSLLLHPDVFLKGKTFPNRLKLVEDYVNEGGSFVMFGGYLSFQGINAAASLVAAYFRPNILKFAFGVSYEFQTIKFYQTPFTQRLTYILLIVFIHHFVLFSFAYFNFTYILEILENTLISGIFTVLLVVISMILFRKRRR